jgi:hypothetical protein
VELESGNGGDTTKSTSLGFGWPNRWVHEGAGVMAMLCARWHGLRCGSCSVVHHWSWRRRWETKEEEKSSCSGGGTSRERVQQCGARFSLLQACTSDVVALYVRTGSHTTLSIRHWLAMKTTEDFGFKF